MKIKYHAHGPSRMNAVYSLTKIVISDDEVSVESVKARNGLNKNFIGFDSLVAHIWHDLVSGAELRVTDRSGKSDDITLKDVIRIMEEW